MAATATPNNVALAEDPLDPLATDQIIVTFDAPGKSLDASTISAVAGEGAESVRTFQDRSQIIRLASDSSGANLDYIAESLADQPGVISVEPDYRMEINTNDPYYGQQWDLLNPASGTIGINVEAAWAVTKGSPDVRIAVVDTGYVDHPDLNGRLVGGYDFISSSRIGNDGDGRDADAHDMGDWISPSESSRGFFRGCKVRKSSWHGSHVAGTIGATTDNGVGIAGINPTSPIVPIRALGKCGGYLSDVTDAVRWAVGLPVPSAPANPHPARVVSLSLGKDVPCSRVWQDSIDAVNAKGAVVVVGAGNTDVDANTSAPANCNNVITVAATGKAAHRAGYSNYGPTVEIAAPGGDPWRDSGDAILSTVNSGLTTPIPGPAGSIYAKYSGTSMATPHVSGVVSLMLSANPNLKPAEVLTILQKSATRFPAGSTCINVCGAGVVNAGEAVKAASLYVPSAAPGAFAKTSPGNGAKQVSRGVYLAWNKSTGANFYEVCVDKKANGQCDDKWVAVNGLSIKMSKLTRLTTFEWQVRAVNDAGTTEADSGIDFVFKTKLT